MAKVNFDQERQTSLYRGFYGVSLKDKTFIDVEHDDGIYDTEDLLNFNDQNFDFVYFPDLNRSIPKKVFSFEECEIMNDGDGRLYIFCMNMENDGLGFYDIDDGYYDN
ncbi:MAG: hypothetical protein C0627_08845 [Sulfurimonas sp.]|nr:MAG: hypothetical protein C0627_08845 [Sulfurimonas sp.]